MAPQRATTTPARRAAKRKRLTRTRVGSLVSYSTEKTGLIFMSLTFDYFATVLWKIVSWWIINNNERWLANRIILFLKPWHFWLHAAAWLYFFCFYENTQNLSDSEVLLRYYFLFDWMQNLFSQLCERTDCLLTACVEFCCCFSFLLSVLAGPVYKYCLNSPVNHARVVRYRLLSEAEYQAGEQVAWWIISLEDKADTNWSITAGGTSVPSLCRPALCEDLFPLSKLF